MELNKAREIFARDRYAMYSGIEIIEAGEGYCKTRLLIEEHHLNAANVVQGGAIFTLADLAFAVACNSRGQLALAVNVNISFLQSRSTGLLFATAKEVGDPKKKLGAYDVLVTDEAGEVIARFNGMAYRKKDKLL